MCTATETVFFLPGVLFVPSAAHVSVRSIQSHTDSAEPRCVRGQWCQH